MLKKLCQSLVARSNAQKIMFLTFVIEATTMFFRFGLGLESTKHTASTVGRLTMGIRIHHGYIGLVMLLLLFIPFIKKSRYAAVLSIVGASLFLSDILHHTLLYLITGSADLDLVYPTGQR